MSTKAIANLTVRELKRALSIRERIESLEKKLQGIFGGTEDVTTTNRRQKRRGGMSPAGRARIAAAMKARWRKAKRAGRSSL
jgi:hypothetical protein